ncbi:T9SS C-terminal target domain-containing protein [Flavobacterium arcticum]|uniref:T9SS C-terminal target domain-containing protein n=1 Tax=Flavobacterium arcticum TaxID=1784713 RepID=A0A345HCV8_9FLAO|nr:T9SS type A sorting domain-containing protein [Flavobacterium arcticum]AXG74418.1 T9SS C-terminal target domain-containing protein [Flavobacterium arcticum]
MKKKLLTLFALMLFMANAYSQAVAYQAPDIFQCGNELFDLTAQNPIVLGSQSPDDFTVAYFESETNAIANNNIIQYPESYIVSEVIGTVYVRVTNTIDDSYDVSFFAVGVGSSPISYMNDFTVCNVFTLPSLQYGNYYTGQGGTGNMLMPGDMLYESQTVYIYNQDEEIDMCFSETSFQVTVIGLAVPSFLAPLEVCDENMDGYAVFDLALIIENIYMAMPPENIIITIHETEESAMQGINAISNPSLYAYTNVTPYQQSLYVRIESPGGECFEIAEVSIIASPCEESILSGTVLFDSDDNGCDANDLAATGLTVTCTNNGFTYYSGVDGNGNYAFNYVPAGASTVAVAPDAYVSFTSSPSEYNVTTPTVETDLDFCLQAEDVNDVLVWLMPTSGAMPGMQASYTLVYANYGSLPSSGTILLSFDDTKLIYGSSSPSMQQNADELTLTYSNLQPFATNYVMIDFTVMQPPTVNMGDILYFEATIAAQVDDNLSNNIYMLDQIVTNSYDPNDITVREGESITPDQAEGYLHYTVRFQNEGTANAQTVRIETQLDANLDWDTFMPMNSSHNYEIVRDDQGVVEFVFNSIDLPYTDADEAGSQGYIIYKIKPVATIALGDVMEASAGIYFDFNEAVLTNTATTTVEATASSVDFTANEFVLYPNPASDNITLKMQNLNGEAIVTVTNILGKTVLSAIVSSNESNLDISMLNSGMYFVTLQAEGKSITKKVVIK